MRNLYAELSTREKIELQIKNLKREEAIHEEEIARLSVYLGELKIGIKHYENLLKELSDEER